MTYWDRLPEAAYFAGVYAQGVQALESLGPQPKIECALRRYVAANAYGIADDHDLVRALAGVFPRAPAPARPLRRALTHMAVAAPTRAAVVCEPILSATEVGT